jgi:hypothetical protein
MYNAVVAIPPGETQISPMRLFSFHPSERSLKETDCNGFPLYRYDNIGTLVIPESISIPHNAEGLSPFASHEQYPFVCNNPVKSRKIHIDYIENHSPHLAIEEGVLYSSDKSRLIFCYDDKTSFVIPRSVTTIEPFAFCQQRNLREISLHEGIVSIGESSFMGCDSLEEIVLPPKITDIPYACFDGCESLSDVQLPFGLKTIGHAAFRNCRRLPNIRLPMSLRVINGFDGCSSLREIEIPSGVEGITGFMFCDSLRKVRLHAGVKRIDDYAFRYCDKLRSINFPDGLEYIGARAFYPSSIHRAVFPDSLREIGDEAFYYNSKLSSLSFASKEIEIGTSAFACCPRLSRMLIRKPKSMKISDKVFIQDKSLDKFGFWD